MGRHRGDAPGTDTRLGDFLPGRPRPPRAFTALFVAYVLWEAWVWLRHPGGNAAMRLLVYALAWAGMYLGVRFLNWVCALACLAGAVLFLPAAAMAGAEPAMQARLGASALVLLWTAIYLPWSPALRAYQRDIAAHHAWLAGAGRDPVPPERHPYYGERLQLYPDRLALARSNGDHGGIRRDAIDAIVVRNAGAHDGLPRCWVDFISQSSATCSVGTLAQGYRQLEQWLLAVPGLDAASYRRIVQDDAEGRAVLWRRPAQANASLPDAGQAPVPPSPPDVEPLARGLWLEDQGQWLAWTTYDALASHPRVRAVEIDMPNPDWTARRYEVSRPVVLGGLQLEKLWADTPAWLRGTALRPGLPVSGYVADVSLGNSGERDFALLTRHISSRLGPPARGGEAPVPPDGERRHEGGPVSGLEACWQSGAQRVRLSTHWDARLEQWRRGCWLEFETQPDLRPFYEDDYQQGLRLHDGLRWWPHPVSVDLSTSHIHALHARYTPDCLKAFVTAQSPLLVWEDAPARRIGFSTQRMSIIVERAPAMALHYTARYYRDEPAGGELALRIGGDGGQAIALGAVAAGDAEAFERIAMKIADELQLEARLDSTHEYY